MTIKEKAAKYLAIKTKLTAIDDDVFNKTFVLCNQIDKIQQQIDEVTRACKTEEKKFKEQVATLKAKLESELTEQITLEDGTKMTVSTTRKLNVINGQALYSQIQQETPKLVDRIKFNFTACGIPKLVEAGVISLSGNAEITKKKNLKVHLINK